MKTGGLLLTIVIILSCSGCRVIQPIEEPQGHYYLNPKSDFTAVSRVVLLELENESTYPELPAQLTQALADGLGKKHLFSVRTISRTDPLWTRLDLDNISTYSYEDLDQIQQELKADALVFGTIKRYQSFPHFQVAMHLKMVDLRQGRLIWAMEEVWDSTDKQVELRMRRYFENNMSAGYEPLNWQVFITSPRAFNKFVVSEIAVTLPELSSREAMAAPSRNSQQYIILPGFQINSSKIAKQY